MALRTVVFFAASDPVQDPDPVRYAFTFALAGHRAGLPTEVRLAGGALNALRDDRISPGADGERLRAVLRDAREAGLLVSL